MIRSSYEVLKIQDLNRFSIRGFFRGVLNAGVDFCQSTTEVRVVKLLNTQALSSILILVLGLCVNLYFMEPKESVVLILVILTSVGVIVLNLKGKIDLAKITFILISNYSIFYYSRYYGRDTWLHLIFIPMLHSPFLFYSDQRSRSSFWKYVSVLIALVCLIYQSYSDVVLYPINPEFRNIVRVVALFSVIFGALTQQICWISILRQSENEIISTIQANERNTQELLRNEIQLTSELATSKTRIETAMKALRFAVWEWNSKSKSLYCDDFMYEVLGLTREENTSPETVILNAMSPADSTRVSQEMIECISKREDFSTEFEITCSNGQRRIFHCTTKCFYDSEGQLLKIIGANWDVSDTRIAELKMMQNSKLASLGEMSAGIAHEINNPLAIISLNAQYIVNQLENLNPDLQIILDLAKSIESTSQRISTTIKGLRSFVRDGEVEGLQMVSVKDLIDDTLVFCKSRFLNSNIGLIVDNFSKTIVVQCHKIQLSQVILNLLVNSFEAVCDLPKKWVRLSVEANQDWVEIAIMDSGEGIPFELQSKIFQPFFTTKPVGKGSGMGLSIAKGIIQAHSGILSLDESSPNTRFVIRLPKTQPES